MPLSTTAAFARRMTPAPKSTRYGVPLTTTAVAGPERSGSGTGFPVPSRTICVWLVGPATGCWAAARGTVRIASEAIVAPKNLPRESRWLTGPSQFANSNTPGGGPSPTSRARLVRPLAAGGAPRRDLALVPLFGQDTPGPRSGSDERADPPPLLPASQRSDDDTADRAATDDRG